MVPFVSDISFKGCIFKKDKKVFILGTDPSPAPMIPILSLLINVTLDLGKTF